jgi:hypothetical protein
MSKQEERTKNREQWREWIEAQKSSDLSQTEFCKQNNLSFAQFNYYRRQFIEKKEKLSASLFTSVQLSKPAAEASLKIILPNSFRCEIPAGTDPSYMKRLIEVLVSC